MKTTPCLYAIVRFCPFVETEEFANVGVLLVEPQNRFFGFNLMTKKHARVTHFFDQLDTSVFKVAMQNLKEELERAERMVSQRRSSFGEQYGDEAIARLLFEEIVRPRETVIRFSKPRAILAAEPKAKLNELYGHYVERNFVTQEYRESAMEKAMRKWLVAAGVGARFERMEVGNDEYHATFPFVEHRGADVLTAVKPLNLGQDQPSKIYDHGGQWVQRLTLLKRKGMMPHRVLVAAEGPKDELNRRVNAFAEVVEELKNAGATVIAYDRKDKILEFLS